MENNCGCPSSLPSFSLSNTEESFGTPMSLPEFEMKNPCASSGNGGPVFWTEIQNKPSCIEDCVTLQNFIYNSFEFSNGLTRDGAVVKLGGALVEGTTISMNSPSQFLWVLAENGVEYNQFFINSGSLNLASDNGATRRSAISVGFNTLEIDYTDTVNNYRTGFQLNPINEEGRILVRDDISLFGMYYNTDYSTAGSLNPLWIPHKGYNDSVYIPLSQIGQPNGVASLDSGGKVPVSQLPNSIMEFKGTWDASINDPVLADGIGNIGDVYRVNVGGYQDLGSGYQEFSVGDFVIYNGAIWQQSPSSDTSNYIQNRHYSEGPQSANFTIDGRGTVNMLITTANDSTPGVVIASDDGEIAFYHPDLLTYKASIFTLGDDNITIRHGMNGEVILRSGGEGTLKMQGMSGNTGIGSVEELGSTFLSERLTLAGRQSFWAAENAYPETGMAKLWSMDDGFGFVDLYTMNSDGATGKIWHAGNSNLPTVDWSANNVSVDGILILDSYFGIPTEISGNALVFGQDDFGTVDLWTVNSEGVSGRIYHSGNSNKFDIPWVAYNLQLDDNITFYKYGFNVNLSPNTSTSDHRDLELPNGSGTLALVTDIPAATTYINNQSANPRNETAWIAGGGEVLKIGTNASGVDYSYIGLYPRTATPTIRGGKIGFVSSSSNIVIENEFEDANIVLATTGASSSLSFFTPYVRYNPNTGSTQGWYIDQGILGGDMIGMAMVSPLGSLSEGSNISLRTHSGTSSSPAATISGNKLGSFIFGGHTQVGSIYDSVSIQAVSMEDWNPTAAGTSLQFYTTPVGTVTKQLVLTLDSNGSSSFNGVINANTGILAFGPSSFDSTLDVFGLFSVYNNVSVDGYITLSDSFPSAEAGKASLYVSEDDFGVYQLSALASDGSGGRLWHNGNSNLATIDWTAKNIIVNDIGIYFQTSAPSLTATAAKIWAQDVSGTAEMKVMDGAGNITTISPHNHTMIPESEIIDAMSWFYYSERGDKRINVNMYKAIKDLESLTGNKYIYQD